MRSVDPDTYLDGLRRGRFAESPMKQIIVSILFMPTLDTLKEVLPMHLGNWGVTNKRVQDVLSGRTSCKTFGEVLHDLAGVTMAEEPVGPTFLDVVLHTIREFTLAEICEIEPYPEDDWDWLLVELHDVCAAVSDLVLAAAATWPAGWLNAD